MINAARSLLKTRSKEKLHAAVGPLLDNSALRQRACQVAWFLAEIGDCLPEDKLADVLKWIRRNAAIVPKTWQDSRLFEPLWAAVAAISPMFDSQTAVDFTSIIVVHEVLKGGPMRTRLIRTWGHLTDRLPNFSITEQIPRALKLVTEDKHDHDYSDSITLLCHMQNSEARRPNE